jgi:hypothetical protein
MRDYMMDKEGWACRRIGVDDVEYRIPNKPLWLSHTGSWSVDAAEWVAGYGYRYVSRLELVLLIPEAV